MKQSNEANNKRFIHRRAHRLLFLATVMFLLLLTACGGGQTPTPVIATTPEATITAPTPTLDQPTSTQPPATATIVPTETALATASPPVTEDTTGSEYDLVTYEDSVSTFALDYPAAWHVIDVAQEIKTASTSYTISFLSWEPDAAGGEGIPPGEMVVEANALPEGVTSLEEATEDLKQSLGPGESILSESNVTLDSGLSAMRWTLQTSAGPTYVLLTIIGDRPFMLRGWGDEALFDLVAGSLRATPVAELPVISNRGAPANERCVVMKNVEGLVDVHASPGAQYPLIAHLENWADVQSTGEGWYEIVIPQGGTGWIDASQVSLAQACAIAEPLRIKFSPGATSATIAGSFSGQAQARYLLRAAAGQVVSLTVTSPQNSVLFHLEGVDDGQVYKHLLDGENSWQGTLTVSQDYLLTIDNSDMAAQYTIELSIVDG